VLESLSAATECYLDLVPKSRDEDGLRLTMFGYSIAIAMRAASWLMKDLPYWPANALFPR
jgi:hypothetical protein